MYPQHVFNLIMLLTCINLFCGLSRKLHASEGVLPKGKGYSGTLEQSDAAAEASGAKCNKIVFQRDFGLTYLTEDNKSLFFVSRIKSSAEEKKAGGSKKGRSQSRDYLLRYDTRSKVVFRKTSFQMGRNSLLIPMDKSASGFVLVSFEGESNCLLGKASGIGLVLNKKINAAKGSIYAKRASGILRPGHYMVAGKDDLPVIADLDGAYFLQLDVRTFQKRRGKPFPSGALPLYLSEKNNYISALVAKEADYSLVRFDLKSHKPIAEIKMDAAYRILQQDESFLFIKPDIRRNQLYIRAINGWSESENRKYKFTLPAQYPVEKGQYRFNIERRIVVVRARHPLKNKRWDKGFVIDYLRDKILGVIPLPRGHFIDGMAFLKDNKGVIFILKDFSDLSLAAIRIFKFEDNSWEPVHISIH